MTDDLPFSQRPTNQIPRQPVYHWIFQLCSWITRAGRLVAGQSGFIFIAVFLRTYQSCLRRYLSFCHAYAWGPFPFSGVRAVTVLFRNVFGAGGRIPGEIWTYLAAVRHAQIMRGLPEPRESSFFPWLRLVQNGVRRVRAKSGLSQPVRLPITPLLLRRIRPLTLVQSMLFRLLLCGRDHRTHAVFV